MRRREFITLLGSAVAWPASANAQSTNQVRRIGFLRAAPPPEREVNAFFAALAENGYVQGRNIVMVPQWGDGNVARLPELAAALKNEGVDIIVAEGTIVAQAAAAAAPTLPIVMIACRRSLRGRSRQKPIASGRKCDWVLQSGHRNCRQGF